MKFEQWRDDYSKWTWTRQKVNPAIDLNRMKVFDAWQGCSIDYGDWPRLLEMLQTIAYNGRKMLSLPSVIQAVRGMLLDTSNLVEAPRSLHDTQTATARSDGQRNRQKQLQLFIVHLHDWWLNAYSDLIFCQWFIFAFPACTPSIDLFAAIVAWNTSDRKSVV